MSKHPYYIQEDARDGSSNLRLIIPDLRRWKGRPAWRLEMSWRRVRGEVIRVLRVVCAGRPVLLLSVDSWWDYVDVCRDLRQMFPGVIPPIRTQEIPDTDDAQGLYWQKFFANALFDSPMSPLHEGCWQLSYLSRRESLSTMVPQVFDRGASEHLMWDFAAFDVQTYPGWLNTRRCPPHDAARVKMWRKHARQGTLPPVLLWHVDALSMFLVIDGHERLCASLLEDVPASFVVLDRMRVLPEFNEEFQESTWEAVRSVFARPEASRMSQRSIENLNSVLVHAYQSGEMQPVTRTWNIPGGVLQWRADLQRFSRQFMGEQERQVVENMSWWFDAL